VDSGTSGKGPMIHQGDSDCPGRPRARFVSVPMDCRIQSLVGRQLDGRPVQHPRPAAHSPTPSKGQIKILVTPASHRPGTIVRICPRPPTSTLLGPPFIYRPWPPPSKAASPTCLNLIEKEMKVAMVLTGARSIADI